MGIREIGYRRRERLRYLKKLDLKIPELKRLGHRRFKKLTILHSNDLHGDFLGENADSGLVGGVSMLSGYINKVRNEEDNVIYAVAGDMFRGSIIDSEYRGLSTIAIMNLLTPDVATIGNHEVDYGLEHLLFIEKCANFPVINANMHLIPNGKRLFHPHFIKEIDGLKIMFIGVLTADVLNATRREDLIGELIDVHDAASEIRKVTDAYWNKEIDLTILLTHIGFEKDKELAAKLGPDSPVDIIIGGHSHTYLEEPCVVEGIPIVQAAVGTSQIGRFDILFDVKDDRIDSYTWSLIPIREDNCPRDEALENFVFLLKKQTDAKYGQFLTRFARAYTHPYRNKETELGDLIAEGIRTQLGIDLVMIGSGSIRKESLGPIVTRMDLMEAFPYTNTVIGFRVTGIQLRHIMEYLLRDENFDENAHCEYFQFSRGFLCEYDRDTHSILNLNVNGKEVQDDDIFTVGMGSYFYEGMKKYLGITNEEVEKNGEPIQLAMDVYNVLEEYMASHDFIKLDGEPRILLHEQEPK